jgi:hypothetical protein
MNAMYNMRLPASESAKLVSARTGERLREYEDAVRATAAEDDVVTAPPGQPRPANHLSGFARA